jgi:hypothetical protein
MFSAQQWDELVADHAPPNAPLVAVDGSDKVVGFTAIHPEDGEMFLLFVEERNAQALAVYAAAGYRPDGTARESDFNGAALRELRLVKPL